MKLRWMNIFKAIKKQIFKKRFNKILKKISFFKTITLFKTASIKAALFKTKF